MIRSWRNPSPGWSPGRNMLATGTKPFLSTWDGSTLRRPYLYNRWRGQGRCPLDSAWGFVDSYSAEVLRLSCRAAASAPAAMRRPARTCSGVVEAGCKVVVGQRLKQSGMLWSRKGAEHLLAVRCALLSGWFEQFWKTYAKSGQALAFAT